MIEFSGILHERSRVLLRPHWLRVNSLGDVLTGGNVDFGLWGIICSSEASLVSTTKSTKDTKIPGRDDQVLVMLVELQAASVLLLRIGDLFID
ncbi:hypothetical protein FYZ48_03125 [Gimesia chilikensis]|uniref:hypothetical protein n=1 Tax=Gimesia chilikensis TaxID=2605989 RepID=UPI0011EE2790|nr:hypothetical protein [Gimesia chilikensis]KAA0142006.1 hypothetical protein FYZ48_03125 [Gimesia chilikensis]